MSITMYGYLTCPYCARVQRAIDDLGAPVELRDVQANAEYREELIANTGSRTVPVLRIEEEGEVRWLKESKDIVGYLYERFGEGRAEPVMGGFGFQRVASLLMWGLLIGGMIFAPLKAVLWTSACALGVMRSLMNAFKSGKWYHYAIAGLFMFATVSIGAREIYGSDFPWWNGVFGFVAILAVVTVVQRVRHHRQIRAKSQEADGTAAVLDLDA